MAEPAKADRDSKGRFIAGVWSGGPGRPAGVPCKASAVRQAFLDTFDLQLLKDLKENDSRTFWQVFAKLMPQQVQAEIGGVGSIGEACDQALRRAGLNGKVKTELGE